MASTIPVPPLQDTNDFELLVFEGNNSAEAIKDIKTRLPAILKSYREAGTPMRDSAPQIFTEDGKFKMLVTIYPEVSSSPFTSILSGANENLEEAMRILRQQNCQHNDGYEVSDNGPVCKVCGASV